MRTRLKGVSSLALVALVLSLFSFTVETAVAATGTTLVGGLAAPRFIAVNNDGSFYVTLSGSGGDEQLPSAPGGGGPPGPPPSRGYTGQVIKVDANGNKTLVADKLPSYNAEGAVGPEGIVVAGGAIWVVNGGAGVEVGLPNTLKYENTLVRINPATGDIAQVADIGAYEKANNPDKVVENGKPDLNSDLYGLALASDGMLYVADAGGNTLYKVNPSTGDFSLVTVFPTIKLPPPPPGAPPAGPPGTPAPTEAQPVPTGVAAAPDGGVYVGLLAGLNFGAGKVVKVTPDGKISDVATGLNPVTGVAVGPDKQVYAIEIATGFGQQGPQPGRVLRILPNGSTQVVADNVPAPNSASFDAAGNMYVTVGTAFAPSGSVLKFNGIAAPPAPTQPAPNPGLPNTGMAGFNALGDLDIDGQTASVQPGISDVELFGKTLSTERPMGFSRAELKPGGGPVVPSRLRIPALSIDTITEEVGLRDGAMDVPSNIWHAGWLNTNPRPGDFGNAVIAGHKDSVKGAAIFWDLGKLKPGDKVYVSDRWGYELTFEVTDVQSYDTDSAPLDDIFGPSWGRQLNLITCDGDFVREQRSYNKRLVVYTRLLSDW